MDDYINFDTFEGNMNLNPAFDSMGFPANAQGQQNASGQGSGGSGGGNNNNINNDDGRIPDQADILKLIGFDADNLNDPSIINSNNQEGDQNNLYSFDALNNNNPYVPAEYNAGGNQNGQNNPNINVDGPVEFNNIGVPYAFNGANGSDFNSNEFNGNLNATGNNPVNIHGANSNGNNGQGSINIKQNGGINGGFNNDADANSTLSPGSNVEAPSRSVSISYNDVGSLNNNLSDLLHNQYFSPNSRNNGIRIGGNNSVLSPMNQPTYFAANNNNNNSNNNNVHLALSPSSYNESYDHYGSLNSPTAISLAHSNSNTGSLTPLVRSPSNQIHSLPKQPLSKEEKLKRRREFHNAVERRRRDHIKERIKDLSNLVPPRLLLYDENGKDSKPNKAAILTKTVEYIESLLNVIEVQRQRKLEIIQKIKELQLLDYAPNENANMEFSSSNNSGDAPDNNRNDKGVYYSNRDQ